MKKTKMLKKNYEFKNVFVKGKYISGEYIEAVIKKNKTTENLNFLGIAINVKIAKAVKRNHIKRLIREVYRLNENRIKTGYSIVFLWKKKQNIINANFENVKKDMENIFIKSNILRSNNEENLD